MHCATSDGTGTHSDRSARDLLNWSTLSLCDIRACLAMRSAICVDALVSGQHHMARGRMACVSCRAGPLCPFPLPLHHTPSSVAPPRICAQRPSYDVKIHLQPTLRRRSDRRRLPRPAQTRLASHAHPALPRLRPLRGRLRYSLRAAHHGLWMILTCYSSFSCHFKRAASKSASTSHL